LVGQEIGQPSVCVVKEIKKGTGNGGTFQDTNESQHSLINKEFVFEGVNVQSDRFLVLVAQVPKEDGVDKLTNNELVKLWRSRQMMRWDNLYQEK